jgi:dienelactone hydrolase
LDLQPIVYPVGEKSCTGYLADGSRGRRAPGILVAHEGNGLSQHSKDRAVMLAELGYVAFALDIYGETDLPLERAQAMLRALMGDLPELRARMAAGLGVLAGQPNVEPARLAAIGFCFGGSAVLELARGGADVACVVGFHAALSTTRPEDAKAIRGKVLVCQGADDPIITAGQRDAFTAEMTAGGVDWQMLVLGGVAHSFTNPDIDAFNYAGFAYDPVADRRSWAAMRALFDETLGPVAG